MKMMTKPFKTILDLWPRYHDEPWQPRGHRVHNGYRQRFVKGIRYENHS